MAKKAKESMQVERARKKIAQQLIASDKQMNPDSLYRMRLLIEQQLHRHSPDRVSLKKRQVVLFDENQHPAATESKFVARLLNEIREGKVRKVRLKGRIRSINKK